MATHNGLIFISLDPAAPPLADYLGDFAFYLDFYTRQSPAGIELRGPQRWRVKANWKIGAENFAGDSYHTPHTHASVVEIGLFREPKASKRKEGALYVAGPGAGTTYKLPPGGEFAEQLRYVRLPGRDAPGDDRDVVGRAAQAGRGQRLHTVAKATLFPNLSFVHNWPHIDAAGTVVPFISLRQWQPVSEQARPRCFPGSQVDAAAPEEFKRGLLEQGLPPCASGSSGMFEQDDVENWHHHVDTAAKPPLWRRRPELNEQPDGPDPLVRPADQAADGRRGVRRPGRRVPGLRRVQPAALAAAVGGLPGTRARSRRARAGPGPARPAGSSPVTATRPLPYADPAHLAAHQFLVEEAALLDSADYEGWLGLLTEDIEYLMPVRVTTARGAGFDALADMAHFDEDMHALRKRVQRLATDHAWTEDPPSRTRHFVTNVRTFRAAATELAGGVRAADVPQPR